MSTTTLAKAIIINLDRGGPPIQCMFNPKEYTVAKQNKWNEGKNSGADVPQLEFGNGQPATLKLQLFFDTYAQQVDVRKTHTDAIWNLMLVDDKLIDPQTKKARPPVVLFQWGSWTFNAVITSISQKFLLFLDNGMPVRAMLDVTFQQVTDPRLLPGQNPTSGGLGGQRIWTVATGDTLVGIAYQVYGDANHWRQIAEANRLTRVRELTPGMELVIPNA